MSTNDQLDDHQGSIVFSHQVRKILEIPTVDAAETFATENIGNADGDSTAEPGQMTRFMRVASINYSNCCG